MDSCELDELLDSVAAGRTGVAEAHEKIAMAPIRDIGYATLDTSRELRQGQGEVVYGAGKTAGQIAGIVQALTGAGQRRVLVTRLDAEKNDEVRRLLSGEVELEYDPTSRLGVVGGNAPATGAGRVVVACAGTSDLPVAEEAARTCEFLGNDVCRLTDVGVAGIHRLLDHADAIASASVVVAVAGMEGALASVVAGIVRGPVIAVPTSVGYGASYGGLAALLAMLNSCASGVSVVNVDNGFGAGFQAHLINHVAPRATESE
ncbi:MAG: nickel pincer cofactor biosynthesis protein LarB [Atopobiaceae bacterium]|nr:nickel pincer cofactor biosynthesis protein LarB [Atopobiaceae bacterium]